MTPEPDSLQMTTTDPLQMTASEIEHLLKRLLPAFLWLNDDGTLAELVSLIADQYWDLHARLGMLYSAMFIQTCPQAIVPYIAQGIGVTGLEPGGTGFSQRAWVGRVVSFREHKGSFATLGRAAIAATGWPAFVTSGLRATARTPSVRHRAQPWARWADIGSLPPFDPSTAVFEPLTRTAGISGQQLASGRQSAVISFPPAAGGQPVPGGAEVSIWRLQAFPLTWRTPYQVPGHPGAYTFDPLGLDSALFVQPQAPSQRLDPPARGEIPVPLTRTALAAALRNGSVPPPLKVRIIGQASGPGLGPQAPAPQTDPLPPGVLAAADLTNWTAPAGSDATAIIDPELGRLLFPDPPPAESIVVEYANGFPGELGGGPYGTPTNWQQIPSSAVFCDVAKRQEPGEEAGPGLPRPLSLPDPLDPYQPAPGQVAAGEAGDSGGGQPAGHVRVSTFEDALAWAQQQDPQNWGIITISDSGTYTAPPEGWQLSLAKNQTLRIISAPEASPVLVGALHVRGEDLSLLEISGLLLADAFAYEGTGELRIEHTAISSADGAALRIQGGTASATFSIFGPVEVGPGVRLSVADTIVDGLGKAAITCQPSVRTGPGGVSPGTLDIKRTTVLGTTEADIITADGCIFTGPLIARLPHRGLISYSYHPAGSKPPPAVTGHGAMAGAVGGWPEAAGPPRFTSTSFGSPAYGQLAYTCPPEIAAGARLGGEMGAYNYLQQPFRADRLLSALDEMLPAGRTATVIYRT
jgi:hypothetical protein